MLDAHRADVSKRLIVPSNRYSTFSKDFIRSLDDALTSGILRVSFPHREVLSMRRLETVELRNALRNLLTERLAALTKVTHGANYQANLQRVLTALDNLPEGLAKLPLVELLALLDIDHDDWGKAIDYLIRAIEEGPAALAPLRPVAELVRARYMTQLAEIRSPYAVEDQRGRDRLATLPADAATLDRVTALDGRALSAWISDYATAGTKLGDNLSNRADTVAAATAPLDATTVQALRGEVLQIVGKLRNQIALDLEHNSDLPHTLQGDVLGYIDELSRLAELRARPAKRATGGETPVT